MKKHFCLKIILVVGLVCVSLVVVATGIDENNIKDLENEVLSLCKTDSGSFGGNEIILNNRDKKYTCSEIINPKTDNLACAVLQVLNNDHPTASKFPYKEIKDKTEWQKATNVVDATKDKDCSHQMRDLLQSSQIAIVNSQKKNPTDNAFNQDYGCLHLDWLCNRTDCFEKRKFVGKKTIRFYDKEKCEILNIPDGTQCPKSIPWGADYFDKDKAKGSNKKFDSKCNSELYQIFVGNILRDSDMKEYLLSNTKFIPEDVAKKIASLNPGHDDRNYDRMMADVKNEISNINDSIEGYKNSKDPESKKAVDKLKEKLGRYKVLKYILEKFSKAVEQGESQDSVVQEFSSDSSFKDLLKKIEHNEKLLKGEDKEDKPKATTSSSLNHDIATCMVFFGELYRRIQTQFEIIKQISDRLSGGIPAPDKLPSVPKSNYPVLEKYLVNGKVDEIRVRTYLTSLASNQTALNGELSALDALFLAASQNVSSMSKEDLQNVYTLQTIVTKMKTDQTLKTNETKPSNLIQKLNSVPTRYYQQREKQRFSPTDKKI